MTSRPPLGKPLHGLLVVSMEQAVAAPTCSAKLADAGARVIKIERAEGDFARGYDAAANGLSTYFVWLNRGKESVCLDIMAPTLPSRAASGRAIRGLARPPAHAESRLGANQTRSAGTDTRSAFRASRPRGTFWPEARTSAVRRPP